MYTTDWNSKIKRLPAEVTQRLSVKLLHAGHKGLGWDRVITSAVNWAHVLFHVGMSQMPSSSSAVSLCLHHTLMPHLQTDSFIK